jgi:hypothetical protein
MIIYSSALVLSHRIENGEGLARNRQYGGGRGCKRKRGYRRGSEKTQGGGTRREMTYRI